MSFIARYFRKNPHSNDEKDKINENDINAFIDRKIEESTNLDYKHINKYTDKIGLCKIISSFANTDGGLLILGISENDHYPDEPTWGNSQEYVKETLEDRIFGRVKPEIKGLHIHPVRHSITDDLIFLIDVPKSNDRPHMSNFRFYTRRNFSSNPMDFDNVKIMLLETHVYKQDLMEKFFEPIYSDIRKIIERMEYDTRDSSNIYENALLKNSLLLQKFSDEVLKTKIAEFYHIIDEREYCNNIYESIAGYIINERLKEIIEKYDVDPKFTDIAVPWVGVYIAIQYQNMRTGPGTTVLTHDLLYRQIGHSQERHNVRSYTIEGYRIRTADDKFFEVPEEEFMTFWENAIADSEKNETLQYLRESVLIALTLGLEIKKMIEKL